MLRLLFLHIQVATTSSPSDAVCLATRPARTASVLRATYRRRHQRACNPHYVRLQPCGRVGHRHFYKKRASVTEALFFLLYAVNPAQ